MWSSIRQTAKQRLNAASELASQAAAVAQDVISIAAEEDDPAAPQYHPGTGKAPPFGTSASYGDTSAAHSEDSLGLNGAYSQNEPDSKSNSTHGDDHTDTSTFALLSSASVPERHTTSSARLSRPLAPFESTPSAQQLDQQLTTTLTSQDPSLSSTSAPPPPPPGPEESTSDSWPPPPPPDDTSTEADSWPPPPPPEDTSAEAGSWPPPPPPEDADDDAGAWLAPPPPPPPGAGDGPGKTSKLSRFSARRGARPTLPGEKTISVEQSMPTPTPFLPPIEHTMSSAEDGNQSRDGQTTQPPLFGSSPEPNNVGAEDASDSVEASTTAPSPAFQESPPVEQTVADETAPQPEPPSGSQMSATTIETAHAAAPPTDVPEASEAPYSFFPPSSEDQGGDAGSDAALFQSAFGEPSDGALPADTVDTANANGPAQSENASGGESEAVASVLETTPATQEAAGPAPVEKTSADQPAPDHARPLFDDSNTAENTAEHDPFDGFPTFPEQTPEESAISEFPSFPPVATTEHEEEHATAIEQPFANSDVTPDQGKPSSANSGAPTEDNTAAFFPQFPDNGDGDDPFSSISNAGANANGMVDETGQEQAAGKQVDSALPEESALDTGNVNSAADFETGREAQAETNLATPAENLFATTSAANPEHGASETPFGQDNSAEIQWGDYEDEWPVVPQDGDPAANGPDASSATAGQAIPPSAAVEAPVPSVPIETPMETEASGPPDAGVVPGPEPEPEPKPEPEPEPGLSEKSENANTMDTGAASWFPSTNESEPMNAAGEEPDWFAQTTMNTGPSATDATAEIENTQDAFPIPASSSTFPDAAGFEVAEADNAHTGTSKEVPPLAEFHDRSVERDVVESSTVSASLGGQGGPAEAEVGVLRAELARITEKWKVSEERSAALSMERDESKRGEESAKNAISALHQDLDACKASRDSLKQALEEQSKTAGSAAGCQETEESAAALSELRSQNNSLRNDVTGLREQLASKGATAAKSVAEKGELQAQLEGLRAEHTATLRERDSLSNEKDELDAASRASASALEELQTKVSALGNERDIAVERHGAISQQAKGYAQQLAQALAEREALLQQRTAGASPQVSELEAKLEAAVTELGTTKRQLLAAQTKVEKEISKRKTVVRQRDETGARLRSAGAEFVKLTEKLEVVDAERKKLLAEAATVAEQRDEISRRAVEAVGSAAAAKQTETEMDRLRSDLGEARTAVEDMSEKLGAAETARAKSKADVDALEGKMTLLADEAAQARAQEAARSVEINSVRTELTRVSAELAASKAEESTLRVQLEAADEAKRQIEALEASSRDTLAREKSELLETVHELRAQVAQLDESVVLYANGLTKLRAAVEAVPNDGTDSETASASFMSSISSFAAPARSKLFGGRSTEPEAAADSADASEFEQIVERVLQLLSSSQEGVRERESEIASLRSGSAEAESSLSSVQQALEEARRDLADAVAKASDFESQLAHSQKNEHELQSEVDSLRNEVKVAAEQATVAADLESVRADKAEADAEIAAAWEMLGGAPTGWGVSRTKLVDRISSMITEIADAQQNSANAEAQTAEMRGALDDARAQAEISDAELRSAAEKVSRLERGIEEAQNAAREALRPEYEQAVAELKHELRAAHRDRENAETAKERLDRECESMRELCSKLTSQFNSRTNELDEAEEKLAYLQDQVATLEEDLEDARQNSRTVVEETDEAHRSDVDKLTKRLQEEEARTVELENSLVAAKAEMDEAVSAAKEAQFLAETHRKAEENLQIAIEQMEAEHESELGRRTALLEKQLEEAKQGGPDVEMLEKNAAESTSKIKELETEIVELRTALGRLADERVDLKLELEEKLSRLNHPDSAGQLVDRRVVRQLLVSYFRVNSVRRRDVLELMSRMLAFSEEDLVAVGIKRRALMDRLGSVVQAPQVDDGMPEPIASVSEKWIEFLMNESVNAPEDDDF